MSNMLYKFLLSTVLIISLVKDPLAKTKFIGTHKDWTAYSNKEKNGKTCFIASEPLKSSGKYNKSNRGKTYVFVTNIKNGTSHEISVVAGFNYKKNTKVKFTIDKNTTLLFPIDDRAWSESQKVDKILVRKMKKGNKLIIEGTSSPGNTITDHYSLSGFTKALSLIDKNCS